MVITVDTILDILRAKSNGEENYLLKDHVRETILRAIQLRDFINQNKNAFTYKFDNEFFEDLIIACFLHDLGKINWKFQQRMYKWDERKSDEFTRLQKFFNDGKNIEVEDHEVLSVIWSRIFFGNRERDMKIRTAILLHHYNQFYTKGNMNFTQILEDYPDIVKYVDFLIKNKEQMKGVVESLIQTLLSEIKDTFTKRILNDLLKQLEEDNFNGVQELQKSIQRGVNPTSHIAMFQPPNKEDESSSFYNFFVFLGCLRRCDYSASGTVKIEEVENLGESVYKDLNEKIKENLKLNEIWQEKILAKNDSDNLVLIAPTGSGKTEFALLWAKNRGKKLIYTLPLRVALNDLYWRFCDKEKGYFRKDFLRILHSTSFIEYLKEEKEGADLDIEEKQTTSKLFSSPLSLTTPDQVFLSSLKYYGFDKLVGIYPLSAIVIDEIQAYNPEMAAIIVKTLDIIKKLNGNILTITATFPPYFEEFIKEDEFTIIDLEKMDDKIKERVKNYKTKRHKIQILDSGIFEYEKQKNNQRELKIINQSFTDIKGIIAQNKNKNVLIIVNNVGKAIELYKKLEESAESLELVPDSIYVKEETKKANLYLLHSRLIEKEKSRRIREIKNRLAELKKKREEKKEIGGDERIVLVATQIVEASVDVDFDILITEISPIDSQIQRWGRIYRNRENIDYSEKEQNIFIFEGLNEGTSAIYEKNVIEKTIEVLKSYQNKLLDYEKERKIIKEVFEKKIESEGKSLKEIFIEEIKKNLEWLQYYSAEKRSEAQRVFRNIAGVQVFVSGLEVDDEVYKALCEVLEDKESWELPLESKEENSIVGKVKDKIKDEKLKREINKWNILETLYSYSFNLPIYGLEKIRFSSLKSFKGFFVLKKDSADLKEILTYGVNKIKETDLDLVEIESSENLNII